MDTNKMREQFEAALVKQAADDGFAKPSLRRNKNNGDYVDPFEQAAWWGWKASREAVVVELPEGLTLNQLKYGSVTGKPEHERWLTRPGAVRAIEAQGLKVAP
ncbi:hypothetical protein OO258_26310 [Pseudomonas sp. DCB_BI]|uniref:hypothetical protein n=1 Tax=Pseudomonas sp. DCB_BI TaxID=2993594 RepID=UPI00224B6F62|nr:hypothetical protein [Pseudomonas sp. DCB_BI]MCX2891744.1 hypothetical protein [Pseudomonas sp. DCB_BI]